MATFLKANESAPRAPARCRGAATPRPMSMRAEMDRIFQRRWLCAGRASELAKPGDFITREIGNESLIIRA